jgi:hypothetical protein
MEPIKINSGLSITTLGFSGYCALKNKFDFALSVGDFIKLNAKIEGCDSRSHWASGLYRITYVGPGISSNSNPNDARYYSYHFEKIKKDGTPINKCVYGWNCQSFDFDILKTGIAVRTII